MEKASQNDCLLKQIEALEIKAREFGFYWENIDQLLEQIQSECTEVKEAWQKHDHTHLEEEVGDLLQAAVSLAVFCDLDPYKTLHKSIEKFQRRYNTVVKLAQSDGHDNLQQQPLEVLMAYWNQAKKS